MQKQLIRLDQFDSRHMDYISRIGADYPEGRNIRDGRTWVRQQVCRDKTFTLAVLEGLYADADDIGLTNQEDYVKVNFWLSGRHTTVLDGFGQHEHDRPEVFITSGPFEMTKLDIMNRNCQIAAVAVCVQREFFPLHLGLAPDELPNPLRSIFCRDELLHTFCQFPITPEVSAAVRAILLAPFAIRRNPVYGQAKCMELMCLLINLMTAHSEKSATKASIPHRHEARLRQVRDMLIKRYAEPITLEQLSVDVGLNRVALSAGFRHMFGTSIYNFLQKQRMERAYDLLQNESNSVKQVASAVGFKHQCNFSTAFQAFFGCSPQQSRRRN